MTNIRIDRDSLVIFERLIGCARPGHRDLPHIAFRVDDMAAALEGENVLLEPFSPSPGFMVAFVLRDGAVIEFMTFEKETDLPWK